MHGEARRRLVESIAARALRASSAPETEVLISGGREALTRFANSAIHQNMSREILEVSIRALDGGRTGRASTSGSDDASLSEAAAHAASIAKRLEPREDLLALPDAVASYPEISCWDAGTRAATPESRARGVREVIEVAAERGFQAAGSLSTDDRFQAVANSRGLFAYGEYTASSLSTTVMATGGTGYAEDAGPAVGRIEASHLARRAAEKAAMSADPIEIPPGEYTAILEPLAVGELLFYLLFGHSCCHFAARAVMEGESFFAGREGQKIFGDNITLRDDLSHPGQWGVPFDAEGMPRKPLTLIENGILRTLTYDRASARQAAVEPTGHGLPLPNTYGSMPQNLVLEGGDTTIERMIASTARGILVTRLWYNRLVDPAELIVTGLTRDGTFLIEDGRISKALRNYRINQSLRAMLNQVTAMSAPSHAAPGIIAPALLVDGFRFSAVVPTEL